MDQIIKDIHEEFAALKCQVKSQTRELALYMTERQEQVMRAIEAGEDFRPVLNQSLINIRNKAAIEATKAADAADAAWWAMFWRSWQAGVAAMIRQL